MTWRSVMNICLSGALALLAVGCASTAARDQGVGPELAVMVSGQGPPIVFIPGLASDGAVWDELVAGFSARHTCHVVTLAGFAGVPPIEAPVLEKVREALA